MNGAVFSAKRYNYVVKLVFYYVFEYRIMENIDMKQRTWFITGVNSGFGRIMTEKLLERGDRVAGTARKLGELDDLKKQYSDPFWLTSLDLTDTPAIRQVVKGAFSQFGRVDVIVNNAGTSATSPGQRRL